MFFASLSLLYTSFTLITTLFSAELRANMPQIRAFVEPIRTYLWQTDGVATNLTVYGLTVIPAMSGRAVGTYPIFNIPLNEFVDFELKASTNNYAHWTDIVYWFDSLGTTFEEWPAEPVADVNASVYFCNPDYSGVDSRAWIKLNLAEPLSAQLKLENGNYQNTVICMPSHLLAGGDTCEWMTEDNDTLIWMYRRRTLVTGERAWHPIVPAQWRTTQITP